MEDEHSCPPPLKPRKLASRAGFTLIEMSIVLVIIGLIVGGVLVGQNLVRAATVRAQVTQIEKFNTAVNTFHEKYGYLPGDINATAAAQFGFVARGSCPGEGDGNGIIEDDQYACGTATGSSIFFGRGEITLFWVDLSTAGLIDGNFSTGTCCSSTLVNPLTMTSTPNSDSYFPEAKIGRGNYVMVWSGGTTGSGTAHNGLNYFEIEAFSQFNTSGAFTATPGIRVDEAYAIDTKIDDGLPATGRVVLMYQAQATFWMINGQNPTAATSTSCADNGGNTSTPIHYSIEENAGAGVNCYLSIQFQ